MASCSVYYAGDLFDHKHLIGNALLAEAIERHSGGRYVCVLPQNMEQATGRAVEVRNQDLLQVISCDLALLNFDGTDLDSGTVVEFMLAKMLDIPTVILRSDFRSSGDQNKDGDPWNLMCSFYPRTRVVRFNAMAWYQQARTDTESGDALIETLYGRMAGAVIEQFDAARAEPPVLWDDADWISRLYRWSARFPGGGLAEQCGNDLITQIIERKKQKGLL